jgi:hypothetical protein
MVGTHTVDQATRRLDPALVGLVTWAALVVAVVSGTVALSIFQIFLLLGPMVVIPLGRPLIVTDAPRRRWQILAAASAIVVALLVQPGPVATAFALPWLAAVVLMALGGSVTALRTWTSTGAWTRALSIQVLGAMASGWLIVGAVSLVANRSGTTPFGLSRELVELGAVHFSYAGFAATVIARCLFERSPHRHAAAAATVATVGGATLVLVGHLTIRPFELAGAIAMTIGVVMIGILSWSLAPPRSIPRVLLRIGALGVIVPMALALQYAWALNTGTAHLPYETIARIHGSLNAVAFSLGGLLAWRLLQARRAVPPARELRPRRDRGHLSSDYSGSRAA